MSTRSGRPGSLPLTDKRELYLRLMSQGMSNSQACRDVGIHRRTGMRWRHGRTVKTRHGSVKYEPIGVVKQISARFLSEDERVMIADLRKAGDTIRGIAATLGRSPSTVSREIRRNADEGSERYQPCRAHKRSIQRRARPKNRKLISEPALGDYVKKRLGQRWSPEQICGALTVEFPDAPGMRITHETIYRTVYDRANELAIEPRNALRTGRIRRKPHRRGDKRRTRFPTGKHISARPAEATGRTVPGHLEGDLIIGECTRSAMGTLVDRCTRYTKLVHLPTGKDAQQTRDALIQTVASLPGSLKRTLTWDQGSEMACHDQFTDASGIPVYFCDPHSPWQRPSNENTNGLLRQYFPKGTDLSVYTAEDLHRVETELNNRPRKTLGWRSPAQVLATLSEASTA